MRVADHSARPPGRVSRWLRRFTTRYMPATAVAPEVREHYRAVLRMHRTDLDEAIQHLDLVAALYVARPESTARLRDLRALSTTPLGKAREALVKLLQRLTDLSRRVREYLSGALFQSWFRRPVAGVRTTRPPGRVLVSTSHVTRGPDVARMTSAMVVRG